MVINVYFIIKQDFEGKILFSISKKVLKNKNNNTSIDS